MKKKILVVDDEENIRFTLDRFLRAEGYDVTTAANYDKALLCMDEVDFDLVFADVILEGKTGIDLLNEVRKRELLCPVVMFTGAPSLETASEAVRLGAFDYLCKPLRQDTLLQTATKALRHKTLADENEGYRLNLEAIFKSVRDAIITVDESLRVLELNDAANLICGLVRSEAIGKPFSSLLHGCNGRCAEGLRETVHKKRSVDARRFECHRTGRPEQIVGFQTYPLLLHGQKPSGAVMVVRDETRLADLERNLEARYQVGGIIGKSRPMQNVFSLIEDLVGVRSSVIITGESGTGKDLAAKALHYSSADHRKPFVKVNCSALPETLLESELFGHVSGAFTGAVKERIGRFKKADGGTIFLDEIGDMSPKMQLRLLNVLQEGEFERVGDSTPVKVDVRVVAATNKNLRQLIKEGMFREDLYYRLRVVELHMPPLRERLEDVPLLVDYFIRTFNRTLRSHVEGLSRDVLEVFMEYPWPGNVRELEHTIEHACILCRGDTVILDNLPEDLRLFRLRGDHADHYKAIVSTLQKAHWNKTQAARMLGLSRQTLYRKMKQYKIEH